MVGTPAMCVGTLVTRGPGMPVLVTNSGDVLATLWCGDGTVRT